jgi:hypothetical protein
MIAITIFIGLFLVFSDPAGHAGSVPNKPIQALCQAEKINKINGHESQTETGCLKDGHFVLK